jgi:nicotinamidase/pyrazinamidase
MNARDKDKPALLIIDMVKDTFDPKNNFPIALPAERIIEPVKRTAESFRNHGWPVVFPTDAYRVEDFIFKGRMKPYSLAGTPGAGAMDELGKQDDDLWLPKPRFSAFFKTDLDLWLKERGVTLCAVAGITTNFCVLTTALDAICCDFKAVILEDCTMASSEKIHEQTLDTYRRSALYPLLRVAASTDIMAELQALE